VLSYRRGGPLELGGAALAGDGGAGLDQGTADAAATRRLADEEVVHQHGLDCLGRGEVPVETGVAQQFLASAGAEQHPVLAGGEKAVEEGAVALLVDVLGLVEALVGGDQWQQ
jgi:hypothetical protein